MQIEANTLTADALTADAPCTTAGWCSARAAEPPSPVLTKLSPDQFSVAQQQQAPSLPRTRIVKDVLRVGRWRIGTEPDGAATWWDVTPEALQQLEQSFIQATALGNRFSLCWGHGDTATGHVDPRDTIALLDQVFCEHDVLWASAYVDAPTAELLLQPGRQVSVRVAEPWHDGAGREYPLALLHVALVDLPVIPGQGPFLDLSQRPPEPLPSAVPPEPQPPAGARAMPFDPAAALPLFNSLLETAGSDRRLVEPLTLDALDAALADLRTCWLALLPAAPDAGAPATPAGANGSPTDPNSNLSLQVDTLRQQVRDLALQLQTLREADHKAAYTARLQSLAERGRITARTVTSLTETGAAHGYDLSLLAPFEDLQMVDFTRRGRTSATPQPPRVEGVVCDLSPAQIQQTASLLTGRAPQSTGGAP